jgi:hypothetical protein
MSDRRSVWATLAGTLVTLGGAVVIYKATERRELCWWTDPIFWIGAAALAAGAVIFVVLLVPPWLTDRHVRQARSEQLLLEGRANQRDGLDEIVRELGQISSQLKGELRWGKRGSLFPNAAWTKNQHLVSGETHTLVDSAYGQAHLLDQETLSATQAELDANETHTRQQAKEAVDRAAEAVRDIRDEIQL